MNDCAQMSRRLFLGSLLCSIYYAQFGSVPALANSVQKDGNSNPSNRHFINRTKGKIPRGLIAVTNTTNWVTLDREHIDLFSLDYVDGVSNYATWSSIEPSYGKYNWSGFDKMMEDAVRYDKRVAYHILAGNHTPGWAYDIAGEKPYTLNGPGRTAKTFLPWVETKGKRELNHAMLSVWNNTVSAFAKHVRQHPQKNRILYVAITGGPTNNGLEIMWDQSNYVEFSKLRWDDDAAKLLTEYWKGCIDIYLDNIIDIPLGLAFTDYFGTTMYGKNRRSYKESQAIVGYALQAATEKGQTVLPMGLWFGLIAPDQMSHPLIKMLRSFDVPFGLQGEMGTPSLRKLEGILSGALELGASWFELWHHDIIRKEYAPTMRKFRKSLRAKSA